MGKYEDVQNEADLAGGQAEPDGGVPDVGRLEPVQNVRLRDNTATIMGRMETEGGQAPGSGAEAVGKRFVPGSLKKALRR
jgi:hypothetical protein